MSKDRPDASRVFWTETEKASIILNAVEIQQKRPDLAGLSLLRAAIKSLPATRRRKLLSLNQVPWFEPGLHLIADARAEGAAARSDEGVKMFQDQPVGVIAMNHDDDPYLPFFREILSELKGLRSLIQGKH